MFLFDHFSHFITAWNYRKIEIKEFLLTELLKGNFDVNEGILRRDIF
jgi:hypothetical protein